MSESLINEHGVEVSTRRIFSWDEFEMFHWDDDGLSGQIVTGEHMHLIRATYAPGSTYPMHSHPHEQFSLLLSGRMRLTVGEETREIGPGDGWYAPADVPHGGEVLGEEEAVFIDVYSPATQWIMEDLKTARVTPSPGESGAL